MHEHLPGFSAMIRDGSIQVRTLDELIRVCDDLVALSN